MTAGGGGADALGELRRPEWRRLLAAARRQVERTGELTGSVSLRNPTDEERHLVAGITGRYRQAGARVVGIALQEVDADLQDRCGMGLLAALAQLDGPVRNRPAERETERETKRRALADARRRAGPHRDTAWFAAWLGAIEEDGTLTRLVRRGEADLLGWASEVLRRLPAESMPLPVLAELATGDTKALAHTPLAAVVLRALALRSGGPTPTTSAEIRAQWESVGVILDDLASQVLVLNLATDDDHIVADWLRGAAEFGIPFRLTLQQLMTDRLTIDSPDVYVCENPAVLRAAAGELGARSAALVCTEGQPSHACHRLLAEARGRIHWRGDFDWTGLRTTAMAIDRYHAAPWRMSSADYLAGFDGAPTEPEPLKGPPATSPWDPGLAAEMSRRGRAVMEERLIHRLLGDLAEGAVAATGCRNRPEPHDRPTRT